MKPQTLHLKGIYVKQENFTPLRFPKVMLAVVYRRIGAETRKLVKMVIEVQHYPNWCRSSHPESKNVTTKPAEYSPTAACPMSIL